MEFAATASIGQMWFERMTNALTARDYQGHYIVQKGEHILSYRLQHSNKDEQSKERIFQLDQRAIELISDADSVLQRQLKNANAQFNQLMPSSPFANFAAMQSTQLANFYRFELIGEQRLANWVTVGLRLAGDLHRHHYHIWLEKKSALPVKVQIVSQQGQILEQFRFVDLHILPVGEYVTFETAFKKKSLMSMRFPKVKKIELDAPDQAREESDKERLVELQKAMIHSPAAWKPSYFALNNYESNQQGKQLYHNYHYSDGINHFSVFITDKQQEVAQQMAQSGASYGMILTKTPFK